MSFHYSDLAPAVTVLYRLWCRSMRYEVSGWERVREYMDEGRPVVISLWHNELFALPWFGVVENFRCTNVVSQHKDAELLARVLEGLGFSTVRGSSTRGGVRALMAGVRLMKREGVNAVFTVDGPRGPRHEVKEGVVYMALKAGAPIVPVRIFSPRAKVFEKAWDRFRMPLPFSTVHLFFGEPMAVPDQKAEASFIEEQRGLLQERMHRLAESFPDVK